MYLRRSGALGEREGGAADREADGEAGEGSWAAGADGGSLDAADTDADADDDKGSSDASSVATGAHGGGRQVLTLRSRALQRFRSAASASAPRQARLGRRRGWAAAQAEERRRLCTSLSHVEALWRGSKHAAALRFELGLARAAEAHARSLAAGEKP